MNKRMVTAPLSGINYSPSLFSPLSVLIYFIYSHLCPFNSIFTPLFSSNPGCQVTHKTSTPPSRSSPTTGPDRIWVTLNQEIESCCPRWTINRSFSTALTSSWTPWSHFCPLFPHRSWNLIISEVISLTKQHGWIVLLFKVFHFFQMWKTLKNA